MTFTKKIIPMGILVVVLGLMVTLYPQPQTASATALSTLAGRDLSRGSTGPDVADLQGILAEQGFLEVPVGVPYGYFGPLTQNALARYQASIGVSPSAGYYGPITRAKMFQVFSAHGWIQLLARENG